MRRKQGTICPKCGQSVVKLTLDMRICGCKLDDESRKLLEKILEVGTI